MLKYCYTEIETPIDQLFFRNNLNLGLVNVRGEQNEKQRKIQN